MQGTTHVILTGNLTADPEIGHTGKGTMFARFNVAVNEYHKDPDGNRVDSVQYLRVQFWAKQAELCSQLLTKGDPVLIHGRLRTDSWDDKNTGEKKYMTYIVGNGFTLLRTKAQKGISKGDGPSVPPQAPEDDLPF